MRPLISTVQLVKTHQKHFKDIGAAGAVAEAEDGIIRVKMQVRMRAKIAARTVQKILLQTIPKIVINFPEPVD